VNRCHGSSVSYNGSLVRSADTASGQKSIAEEFGLNYWNASDAYYYCVWFHPPTRWLRRLRL